MNYIETLGVSLRTSYLNLEGLKVQLNWWDIGGAKEFQSLLSVAVEEANCVLLCFDLSKRKSLQSIKQWWKNIKQYNCFTILVGCKYDLFQQQSEEFQREIIEMAQKYAKNMRKSPLVFTSSQNGNNINRLVKLAVCMCFGVNCGISKQTDGCIFEYENYWE